MRRLVHGSVLAALLVLAVTTGYRPFYLLLYALLGGLALGLAWAWLQGKGLAVTVSRLNLHPQVGRPVLFRVTIQETLGLPRLNLRVRLSGEGMSESESLIDLPVKDSVTWTGMVEGQDRGPGTSGAVDVLTSDPLGLVRLTWRLAQPHSVLIYPATVSLPPSVMGRYGNWGEGGEYSRRGRESLTAARVREYVPGDSLSHLHWPSTARTAQLMTKEFDSGGEIGEVWLFLDMQATTQAGEGVTSTGETAIVLAASLAQALTEVGKAVGLVAQGNRRYLLSPARGSEQLDEIMQALALIHARGRISLPGLVAELGLKVEQGSNVVLIAPWPAQPLAPVHEHFARRGIPTVPVLLDVGTFGLHGDARWLRDPHSEFPGGACLVRRQDDPVDALDYVMQRLVT